MKIIVHDFSGHPFQVELSRWLARIGHTVLHIYSADVETPRGSLKRLPSDPDIFTIRPISTGRVLNKYNYLIRSFQETKYANALVGVMREFDPDIVLSGNASPIIQKLFQSATHRNGGQFVFWVQDLYSVAFEKLVQKKLPILGVLVSSFLRRLEFNVISKSDEIVVISNDFVPLLTSAGVNKNSISIIENWAPIDEIPELPRNNAWSQSQGLSDKFVFLYSGTLGLKHNPNLLSQLANSYRSNREVRVVVISNGLGRKWLETEKENQNLDNLLLFDLVPYEKFPEALATGDVLICILEPAAGILSVPSKVLSYLCVGRPILGAIPPENLAARTIKKAKAGLTAAPISEHEFISYAKKLYEDHQLRETASNSARNYAENNFDIEKIGTKFINIFERIGK